MRELQVRNRSSGRAINTRFLRELTRTLLEEELGLSCYELGIHFVSAKKMAAVNWDFLQHEGSTDVITFDYRDGYSDANTDPDPLDLAGEIFISVDDAEKQSREFRTTCAEELVRYVVHGLLHLQGYDDLSPGKRRIMKREENRLVRHLQRHFEIARVAR